MTAARLALVLVLCSSGAFAGEGTLAQAERAYDDLAFEKAARLFREALGSPGTREERIRAWRGLGLTLAFLGDAEGAQRNFEALLVLDPEAKVNLSLGPKISRPFRAAKAALAEAPPRLEVSRDERTGEVRAELTAPPAEVAVVVLRVTAEGAEQVDRARPGRVARVAVPPHLDVLARAEALDEGEGVLLSAGTKDAPLELEATVRPLAVQMAMEEARGEEEPLPEVSRGSTWPFWVGGAVALIGGGVAAWALTRPQPLTLPPADRTGRLP